MTPRASATIAPPTTPTRRPHTTDTLKSFLVPRVHFTLFLLLLRPRPRPCPHTAIERAALEGPRSKRVWR